MPRGASGGAHAALQSRHPADRLGILMQWSQRFAAALPPPQSTNAMAYPPEFLQLVDEFIHLANRLAETRDDGEVSAAILFAAGRYNAFNFLTRAGDAENRKQAVEFYVSEYRKAIESNLDGVVGPVVRPQD